MTVHWLKGGPVEYPKSNRILKCVIESSACFQVKELLVSRGGSYDHPCLTKLVEPAAYAAPDTFDVEGIIDHRGTGPRREYLVKWVGYRIETWVSTMKMKDCKDTVEEYHRTYWKELEPESEENESEKE